MFSFSVAAGFFLTLAGMSIAGLVAIGYVLYVVFDLLIVPYLEDEEGV